LPIEDGIAKLFKSFNITKRKFINFKFDIFFGKKELLMLSPLLNWQNFATKRKNN
jgi:hypothetical protein